MINNVEITEHLIKLIICIYTNTNTNTLLAQTHQQ